jgi:hypothetical protein
MILPTIIYAAAAMFFLTMGLTPAYRSLVWGSSFWLISVLAALVLQTLIYLKGNKYEKINVHFDGRFLLGTMAGGFVTYLLIWQGGWSPVAASTGVGLLAGWFFPEYALIIFCGSFVGMSHFSLLSPPHLMVAVFLGWLIYETGRKAFVGIGGKLGATAFMGTLLTVYIFSPAMVPLGIASSVPILSVSYFYMGIPMLIICAMAAYATFLLTYQRNIHVVAAASIVGGIAALSFPLLFKVGSGVYVAGVYCAAFAGMCTPTRIPGRLFYPMVGLFSGILFLASSEIFIGYGGKLGMIAFIASITTKLIFSRYQNR